MKKFLYDEIAKRWYRGGTIWLYSDPHFSDIESYKLRFPKNFPEEHVFTSKDVKADDEEGCKKALEFETRVKSLDDMQIKNINFKVGKNDTIIFLGDIGDIECIKKIKGYKVLIMGNHDKGASNYKRVERFEKIDVSNYLDGKTPNELCIELSDEEREQYYEEARKKAEREYKAKPDFIRLSNGINYDFHSPFMSWCAYFDNRLFDEVYEGPLMINDRVILSHEPIIPIPNCLYNIHGHVHNALYKGDDHHMNCCAEAIDFIPINLGNLIKHGLLKNIPTIHRVTIDFANKKKGKK